MDLHGGFRPSPRVGRVPARRGNESVVLARLRLVLSGRGLRLDDRETSFEPDRIFESARGDTAESRSRGSIHERVDRLDDSSTACRRARPGPEARRPEPMRIARRARRRRIRARSTRRGPRSLHGLSSPAVRRPRWCDSTRCGVESSFRSTLWSSTRIRDLHVDSRARRGEAGRERSRLFRSRFRLRSILRAFRPRSNARRPAPDRFRIPFLAW